MNDVYELAEQFDGNCPYCSSAHILYKKTNKWQQQKSTWDPNPDDLLIRRGECCSCMAQWDEHYLIPRVKQKPVQIFSIKDGQS